MELLVGQRRAANPLACAGAAWTRSATCGALTFADDIVVSAQDLPGQRGCQREFLLNLARRGRDHECMGQQRSDVRVFAGRDGPRPH